MIDHKATLKKFGLDPAKIVQKRMARATKLHNHVHVVVGKLICQLLILCDHQGFGNASRLHVLHGAADPTLSALAIAITYPPDMVDVPENKIPMDSLVYAGLFLAYASDHAAGRDPEMVENALHDAHQAFEKVTGRVFRDCFIDTCGCDTCKRHRERTGIKLNPDRTDRWI